MTGQPDPAEVLRAAARSLSDHHQGAQGTWVQYLASLLRREAAWAEDHTYPADRAPLLTLAQLVVADAPGDAP